MAQGGLHYRRDVTIREDRCGQQSAEAVECLAIFHNLTIGLLRWLDWENLARAQGLRCSIDGDITGQSGRQSLTLQCPAPQKFCQVEPQKSHKVVEKQAGLLSSLPENG